MTHTCVTLHAPRGFEHGRKSDYSVLDPALRGQVRHSSVMLDGEIIVWNKTK